MKPLSSAVEDYLKAIYEIQYEQGHERVSTSRLAEKLGITRASVTGMLKKLARGDPKLIEYERYRGVQLTKAGEKIALEVIRHHRLIELYLTQALGFSWDEVDAEADRLEHVLSDDLEDRIAERLGHPSIDPHGAPIPDREGYVPMRDDIPLTELEVGSKAYIIRVLDDDPALLRELDVLGLRLNSRIELMEKDHFGGSIHVQISGVEGARVLARKMAERIFVSERIDGPR